MAYNTHELVLYTIPNNWYLVKNFSTITQIIYLSVFLSFSLMLIVKILIPFFNSFLDKFWIAKPQAKKPSLDHMIEKQKLILRKGMSPSDKPLAPSKGPLFDQRFKSLSQKKDKTKIEAEEFESLKKKIDLFSQLDWGSNPQVEKIQSEVDKKLKATIPTLLFTKSVKLLHSLSSKQFDHFQAPPFYQNLDEMVKVMAFCFAIKEQPQELEESLELQEGALLPTLYLLMEAKEKIEFQSYKYFVEDAKAIKEQTFNPKLLLFSHQYISKKLSFEAFLESFKALAHLIQSLNPLNEVKTKREALKLLNLDPDFTKEQLNKTYKKLSTTYHPDRFNSDFKGDFFQKRMSANFSVLKEAYDILKRDLKDKA